MGTMFETTCGLERLSLLGLSHVTSPLNVRERLVFDRHEVAAAIADFLRHFGGSQIVLLSTCNRMEIYSTRLSAAENQWRETVTAWLARARKLPAGEISPFLHARSGRGAMEHLFSVAASLDSMVLGETQILGQVRAAYELAVQLGAAGSAMHPLFQSALAVGKDVANRTALGHERASIAALAVRHAQRLVGSLDGKTVLCVGAGKMSRLVMENISVLRPRRLLVCNRDRTRALAMTECFQAEAVDLADLNDHLASADLVFCGSAAPSPLITRQMIESAMKQRGQRPMTLIDIALPRNVEASAGEVGNVHLSNLDDLLHSQPPASLTQLIAVESARAIVAEHAGQFVMADRARMQGAAIRHLYARHHATAQDALSRAISAAGGIAPERAARLREQMRLRVNRSLHPSVVQFRRCDRAGEDEARRAA